MPTRHLYSWSKAASQQLEQGLGFDLGFLAWTSGEEATFSEEAFKPTARFKSIPQVYVFHGPSGIGKSYLGMHLESLSVYETDKDIKLPDNLNEYEVIILGNRSGFTLNDVKQKLTGVNVIPVQFGV